MMEDVELHRIRLFQTRHHHFSIYVALAVTMLAAIQMGLLQRQAVYLLPLLCLLPLINVVLNDWLRRQTRFPHLDILPTALTGLAVVLSCGLLGWNSAGLALLFIWALWLFATQSLYFLLIALVVTLVMTYQINLLLGSTLQLNAAAIGSVSIVSVTMLGLYAVAELYLQIANHQWQVEQTESAQRQAARYLNMADKIARYAPAQVWQAIARGERDVQLENKRRKLTVFFSDIQGFTELSERLSPDDLAAILNHYLDKMTDITKRYGGTLDKFIGDGLVIFYGDPVSQGAREDALACVAMAVTMRRQISLLRQQWQALGFEGLHVRMGISTGYSHVGNFGSSTRLNYTIIGRDTNLAARLQAAAQPDQILISHDTYLLIRDQVTCQPGEPLKLKGLHEPVPVYEVIDFNENIKRPDQIQRWTEFDFEGFNLQLDMDEVKEHEREQILRALRQAERNLMNQTTGNTVTRRDGRPTRNQPGR